MAFALESPPVEDAPESELDVELMNLELTVSLHDRLDAIGAFEGELAEVLGMMAERMVKSEETTASRNRALQLQLDALRPKPTPRAPEPDPLQSIDNVLNGLAQVLKRIDQLKVQIDLRDKGESTFTFDPNGTTRIRREDGTEMVIERDINSRQVRIRRRR